MTRRIAWISALLILPTVGSCGFGGAQFVDLPVETRFAFTNFSKRFYATLSIREHRDSPGEYVQVPLLAPGATFRGSFLEALGTGCPGSVDLRLVMYRRVNDDVPIGLDNGEAVEATPIVAGETLDVPACDVQVVETYTMVNWDAEEGVGRVKIAQDTAIGDVIRQRGLFDGIDATWQVVGVDPMLANTPPPALADNQRLTGAVTLADGTGVEGIGVLLRTRFRVRANDDDPGNDPDAGFGDPIAVTTTAADGSFSFDRPAGAYQIEGFADDFAFRPESVLVESPIEIIRLVAEPVER